MEQSFPHSSPKPQPKTLTDITLSLMCFLCTFIFSSSSSSSIRSYLHMRPPHSTHRSNLFSSLFNFFQLQPPVCASNITAITAAAAAAASTTTEKEKIVVILGATGAGKSRLSIDLATRVSDKSEIINSDKMQLYAGLDITTNKITMRERLGVRHHLLGVIDPTEKVTPLDYRKLGSEIISDVNSRGGLPVVVGGSNSLIYSLVAKQYDPESDVFNGSNTGLVSSELRYDCCLIWVDVGLQVLNQYLSKRVEEMMNSGMFEELAGFYRSGEWKRVNPDGLGQSIGIPEFERYFTEYDGFRRPDGGDSEAEVEAYDEAVRMIKENTCQLAKKQVGKILRLRKAGWEVKRVDATEAFRAVVTAGNGGGTVAEIWEKLVVEPSVKIVKEFLDG